MFDTPEEYAGAMESVLQQMTQQMVDAGEVSEEVAMYGVAALAGRLHVVGTRFEMERACDHALAAALAIAHQIATGTVEQAHAHVRDRLPVVAAAIEEKVGP